MCLRVSEMKFDMECPRGFMMIACVLQRVTFHIDGAVGRLSSRVSPMGTFRNEFVR